MCRAIRLGIVGWSGRRLHLAVELLRSVSRNRRHDARQYWRRKIVFPDGKIARFNSFWIWIGDNQLIEFVNPVLGLQMAVRVENGTLHYSGVRFIAKIGKLLLPIPEWLALGHTTIVEEAQDEQHFAMDFRLVHPLLGQVFRYAGRFETHADKTSR